MSTLRHFIILLFSLLSITVHAQQIYGTVTDDETGDSIAFASVVYKGHNIAAISDINGQYKIGRHEGWNITFSAVGYKTRIIPITNKTKARLNIKLKPDKQMLAEVTVKAKRGRYSRKNNPAVELMKRVVAAKKQTDLSQNDYYQYNKYEKITLSMNDLKPEQLETEGSSFRENHHHGSDIKGCERPVPDWRHHQQRTEGCVYQCRLVRGPYPSVAISFCITNL